MIARYLSWTALGSVGVQAGRLLLLLLLAREMPAAEFGALSIVHTLLSFSSFFSDAGVTNILYQADLPDRNTRASLFWWGMGWAAGLALLLTLSAGGVAGFYDMPALRAALPVAGLGMLLASAGNQHRTLLRRDLRFAALAQIDLLALAVRAVLSLWWAHRGYGCLAVVWGTVAGNLVALLLYAAAGARDWLPRFYFSRRSLRPYLAFGRFQMGERAANYLAERSDVLIIGKVLGAEALGCYDVMKQLLARPESVFNVIGGTVALPLMARRASDTAFLSQTYLALLRRLNALNFPLFICCMALPGPLLALGLGPGWAGQERVFQWLAAYQLLHSTYNPVGVLQMATARADLGFYWNLCLLLLMPACVWAGLGGGLHGVAFAIFVLFLGLLPLFFHFMIRPLIPISFGTYLKTGHPALPAAVLPTALLLGFGGRVGEDWPALLGLLLGCGGLYALGLYLFYRNIFDVKGID